MQDQVLAEHLPGDIDKRHIGPDGVAVVISVPVPVRFAGDARTVPVERVNQVHIDGHAEPLQLPVAGHGDPVPSAHIVIFPFEPHRAGFRILRPMEQPLPVQRDDFRAVRLPGRQLQRRMIRQLVDTQHLRVFPIVGLRRYRKGQQQRPENEDSSHDIICFEYPVIPSPPRCR